MADSSTQPVTFPETIGLVISAARSVSSSARSPGGAKASNQATARDVGPRRADPRMGERDNPVAPLADRAAELFRLRA